MNHTIIVPVGLDWADAKHDFHLITPDGQSHAGVFEQDPQAIADQIAAWRKLCPDAIFAVAIEASKGAIINALLEYHDVQIYPVNPAALASYRKAFAHGGGKNDPVDAKLLAQFICHYREQLTPLKPNSELTRKIATMPRRPPSPGRPACRLGQRADRPAQMLFSRCFGVKTGTQLQ